MSLLLTKAGPFTSNSAFNPSAYGNVWAYHKLNTGITEVAGVVSQWDDQSGNARHFTQSTVTNRPTKTAIGGLKFDGVNDTMDAGSQASPTEYTQFFLYKPNQLGNSIRLSGGTTQTSSLYIENNYTKNADPKVVFGNNTTYTLGGTFCDILEYGSFQLISVKVTAAGNAFEIWVNGIKEVVSYTNQNAGCGGFSGTFSIGNLSDCEILESLIYDQAISEANIETINNYLLGLVSYTEVGQVINTGFTSAGDLSGWVRSIPAQFTTSAGGLIVNGSAAATCKYTATVIGIEDWDIQGRFNVGNLAVSNFGLTIGLSPVAAGYATQRITFYTNSAFPSVNGKIEHWNGGTMFAYSSAMALSSNDVVYYHCIRRGCVYRSRFWKGSPNWDTRTTGVEVSDYRSLGTTFTGNATLGHIYIENQGAATDLTIEEFIFTDRSKYGVEYMFIGDSITVGQAAGYRGLNYQHKAIDDCRKIVTRAGGQERPTVQMSYMSPEVFRIQPQKVFILMGVNDVYYGVPTATIVQAVSDFVAELYAGMPAIQVYVMSCTAYDDTNAADLPVLNAAYAVEFGPPAVDMYAVTENPGAQPPYRNVALYGDTVHPNAPGDVVMAAELVASGTL